MRIYNRREKMFKSKKILQKKPLNREIYSRNNWICGCNKNKQTKHFFFLNNVIM